MLVPLEVLRNYRQNPHFTECPRPDTAAGKADRYWVYGNTSKHGLIGER